MSKSSVEVWLWLLLVMKPYNKKTNFILSGCNYDAAKACEQIRDGKLLFLTDSEKRRADEVRMGDIRKVQKLCAENSVRIITLDDEEYPERLRNIENPPIVLFCAGSLEGLNERLTIAAVGARSVSDYTIYATEGIIAPLAKSGTVIVSGLALGSDAAAHSACLKAGGKTVGVLGCGILVNYPSENAELKREIVNGGGAVISELLPTAKSSGGYFPIRNRIISGLSHGTLVLQAGVKSGSLLTANHALEQGREIFCIPPHDIFAPMYSGAAGLLRSGALPVFAYTDIMDAFTLTSSDNAVTAGAIVEPRQPEPSAVPKKSTKKAPEKAAENPEPPALKPDLNEDALTSLDPREAELLKLLFGRPADADYLMEKLEFEYDETSELLTSLEICGYISKNRDGLYYVV